jgi:2,3-dihydroxyphenylpropionate 1,2-dioxygenase
MVPLHFLTPRYDVPVIPVNINCQGPPLTPLTRAWALGEALRRPATPCRSGSRSSRPAGSRTGPATTRLGKDQRGLGPRVPAALVANERDALVAYNDEDTYREAGQGGFEIRTFVAPAAAAKARRAKSGSTSRSRSLRSAARSA